MQSFTQNIENQLMCLPAIQRACIAEKLLSSLDSSEQKEIDQAWAAEAEDRIATFNNGDISVCDASDVHQRLEKKYNT